MINLSTWIDTFSGDILNNLRHPDEMALLRAVHCQGVESLLGRILLQNLNPRALLSAPGLRIKLSEEVLYRATKVSPGVSENFFREHLDDWNEGNDFPKERHSLNSRELPIEYRYVVLGEFRPSTSSNKIGTIWLYPKAMASCKFRKISDFETVFWTTLAHEVFHVFHYCQLKLVGKADRWWSGRKKDRELVMETLAAYFEYSFLHLGPSSYQLCKYKEDEWKGLDVDGWYYSGALGIHSSYNSERLFTTLYDMSFHDWKTAADIIRTGYYLCSPEISKELGVRLI